MTTLPEFQIPKISSETVDDNRGTLHDRAPRQGLRLHLRQQPAPRAALLARRRRDQERSHRGRRPRVLGRLGGEGGRHRHRPQPQGHRDSHAHGRRRGRGSAGRHRPRRGEGEGHRPARRRGDPEPGRPDRHAREADQAGDVPDDRPRARLLPGRGEQGRGPAARGDPDRLDLLADPSRLVRGRLGARRPADRLRQAVAGDRDRRLDGALLGAPRGGRDPDQEPGDLHRRRPGGGADQPRRRGCGRGRLRAARHRRGRRPADRGAGDRRARVQLPEAGRDPDGRRPDPALRVGAERDPELRPALHRRGDRGAARARARRSGTSRRQADAAMRHRKARHKLSRDAPRTAARCCATSVAR